MQEQNNHENITKYGKLVFVKLFQINQGKGIFLNFS